MERIYLDNASTSFPKPEAVPQAMYQYMCQVGSNINRGCYRWAYQVEETVYEARQLVRRLFWGDGQPQRGLYQKTSPRA